MPELGLWRKRCAPTIWERHPSHHKNSTMTKQRQPVIATMHAEERDFSFPRFNVTSPNGTVPLPTRLVLSALAGMGAATFCHPLDVIRVQLQTSSAGESARQVAVRLATQGGLYAGISAAYLRQWLYGSCRMGLYSYQLEKAKESSSSIGLWQKLQMGSIAGAVGSLVGTPSEVALVRMGADSKLPAAERRNYTGVLDCLTRMAREEGVLTLWKGATPTVCRATLLSACQMGVTSEAKAHLAETGWFGPDGQAYGGYPRLFCATLVASLAANVVANPFDVIKSRMQQQSSTNPMYTGMLDCLRKSVSREGPMVLFAGFGPAFLKLAPYSVLSLTIADKLTKAVTGKEAL